MTVMDAHDPRSSYTQSRPASTLHRHTQSDRPNAINSRTEPALDADSAYASFAEPPHKFRKTQSNIDKSRGIGLNIAAAPSASIYAPSSLQPTDAAVLPFPTHAARLEADDLTRTKAALKESLKNGSAPPGVPASPVEAPRFPGGQSDYFPWQGNHPEDQLTETVTRTGYPSRASNTNTELNSARLTVTSCIRNTAACDALSDLLASAVDRRRQICSVSAKNTFKPPPRVTLTDNKREAWLKDLADAAIPLRRLSRTIPHGIRGKSLLDHCLAKHVPTWRALWLVRCVGSNEIRAFRRKGAGAQAFGGGGEIKWIKDWTQSVVQFIDGFAKTCEPEKPDGRQHLTYALSLISQVYCNQLLDRNAFAESLTSRIQTTAPDQFTACQLWISIARQYLTDVLKSYPRGCELVKALLSTLRDRDLIDADRAMPAALMEGYKKLLLEVFERQPASFIMPGSWSKCSGIVHAIIPEDKPRLLSQYHDLDRRNSILSNGLQTERSNNPSASEVALNTRLNELDVSPDPEVLVATCQSLAVPGTTLVQKLVAWCTSAERCGLSSIYLVARAIRVMSKKLGYSCQVDMTKFITAAVSRGKNQLERLYTLTAELVRSQHFSVSKYLHFLLARGIASASKAHMAVLQFIPRPALTTEVLNLANSMCSSLKCAMISDKDEVDFQVAAMQLAISKCRPTVGLTAKDHAHISALYAGTRSAIALHLRKDIASKRAEQSYPSPDENNGMDVDSASLQARLPATLSTFELLRDFPTLADVLILFIPGADSDSLVILALSVRCHYREFLAMGALQRLFADLLKRYAVLHQDSIRDRELTRVILELARLTPKTKQTISILEKRLDAIVPDVPNLICSPVSDQMLEDSQVQELRNAADLEQLLFSGNAIGDGQFEKVLGTLMSTMQEDQHDPEKMSRLLRVLHRLADADGTRFQKFLSKYLDTLLMSKDTNLAQPVVQWIIAGELRSVDELIDSCLKHTSETARRHVSSQMAFNVLAGLASTATVNLCNCVRYFYSFTSVQNELLDSGVTKLARLTELALSATVVKSGMKTPERLISKLPPFLDRVLYKLLCGSCLPKDTDFENSLMRINDEGGPIEELLCRVLGLDTLGHDDHRSTAPVSILGQITGIVAADNLGPCQLLAQIQLKRLEQPDTPPALLAAAASTMLSGASSWAKAASWPVLLSKTSARFNSILHEKSLEKLLSLREVSNGDEKTGSADLRTVQKVEEQGEDIIAVLEATNSDITSECLSNSFVFVMERLTDFATIIAKDSSPQNGLQTTLQRLLHTMAIHMRPCHLPNIMKEKLAEVPTTLSQIYIYMANEPQYTPTVLTQLLDLLLYVSTSLSEETRRECLDRVQATFEHVPQVLQEMLGVSGVAETLDTFFIENGADSPASFTGSGVPSHAQGLKRKAFALDPWELLQDTTPAIGSNDTCVSLTLFGARTSSL